jgi:hypothetical protein
VPLPPGSSTVFAIPLLLVAAQMTWGARHLWLPAFLGKRTIKRVAVSAGVHGAPGRVGLLQQKPSMPSSINRLFDRQMQVGDLPVSTMITELSAQKCDPDPPGMFQGHSIRDDRFQSLMVVGGNNALTSVRICADTDTGLSVGTRKRASPVSFKP